MALVWDFYRELGKNRDIGGVLHYSDQTAQSIFLQAGINTQTTVVENGHWTDAVYSDPVKIDSKKTSLLRLDHSINGMVYGVAAGYKSLRLLRYMNTMDLSDIADSFTITSMIDSEISQFTCNVQNVNNGIFTDEASIFQPGSKIDLKFKMGDSDPMDLGTIWLDDANHDPLGNNVDFSGRNSIGFYLKDQTFDDAYKYSGTLTSVATTILTYAGITDFQIQTTTSTGTFTFEPDESLLSGLQKLCSYFSTDTKYFRIAELPSGKVIIGTEEWVGKFIPNGIYNFNGESEVLKRNTSKAVDNAYSYVRATGKDSANKDLTPVMVAVESFTQWNIGKHKTKHITAPAGFTQAQLKAWATAQAKLLTKSGLGEDFTSPIKPQLIVGDIANMTSGSTTKELGVVTEVNHTFNRREGYRTEFTVDSGGVIRDYQNYPEYDFDSSDLASTKTYSSSQLDSLADAYGDDDITIDEAYLASIGCTDAQIEFIMDDINYDDASFIDKLLSETDLENILALTIIDVDELAKLNLTPAQISTVLKSGFKNSGEAYSNTANLNGTNRNRKLGDLFRTSSNGMLK